MNNSRQFLSHFLWALLLSSLTLLLLRSCQPFFWQVLFPDDGYYYLRIAQNLAAGLGSTFDGINQTNGYHPLWMLCLVPLAAFFKTPTGLATATLAVQVLMLSAGFGLLGLWFEKTGRKKDTLWLATALVLLNPALLAVLVNLMESALYFWLLAAGLWLWTRLLDKNPAGFRHWLGGGAFFGLVFLARLDGVILAFWLLAAIWLCSETRSVKLKRSAAFAAGFFLPAAPYLIYNTLAFGHPVPISGRIKAVYMAHNPIYLAGLGLIFFLAAGIVFVLHLRARGRLGPGLLALFSYMEFAVSVIFYYLLTPIFALASWYYLPALMVALLLAAMAFAWQTRAKLLRWLRTLAIIIGGVGIGGGYFLFLDRQTTGIYQTQAEVIEWLKQNTAPESLLAAWSSGAVAYFSERKTINLDGLVNSPDYFFNYRRKGKRDEFIRKMGVNYIVVYYYNQPSPPLDKFNFPLKVAFSKSATSRGLGTHFQKSVLNYYVLQTGFDLKELPEPGNH